MQEDNNNNLNPEVKNTEPETPLLISAPQDSVENNQNWNTTGLLSKEVPESKPKKPFFLKNIINRISFKPAKRQILKSILAFLIIFAVGAGTSYLYFNNNKPVVLGEKQDINLSFLLEIYDTVKTNYWNNITDPDLAKLYQLGTEKLTSRLQEKEVKNKDDITRMYVNITRDMNSQQKLDYTKQLAAIILANLQPFGRSGLYSQKDEESLKNRVQNIDPGTNLYDKLGVGNSASSTEIKQAFESQSNKLSQVINNKDSTTEQKQQAQQDLGQVNRAFDTLSEPDKKTNYDQNKIEATTTDKLIRPGIFYLKIKQLSPQTFEEFQKSLSSVQGKEGVDALIIDLRENFGGAIDILPYFLGPFIGQGRYAYDFFHQGEYLPYKTRVGFLPSLYQYKKVVVLIDGNVQSSAEVMASTFKKYHVGILVGEHTKGWGTVERVFPIKNQVEPGQKYSMLLVHSLTLREDNQPIEGRGVEPDINIKANWEKQLYAYFRYDQLTEAVKELYKAN